MILPAVSLVTPSRACRYNHGVNVISCTFRTARRGACAGSRTLPLRVAHFGRDPGDLQLALARLALQLAPQHLARVALRERREGRHKPGHLHAREPLAAEAIELR